MAITTIELEIRERDVAIEIRDRTPKDSDLEIRVRTPEIQVRN